LFYSKAEDYKLVGYSDNHWCGDIDDQKSISGYVFFMDNTTFSWLSKKQPIIMLLMCEVEYVESSWCVCLRNLLRKMELKQLGATMIQVDNKSAIELAKNPMNHERSKHIDVRFHFIRDHVKKGSVELMHVASQYQVSDIFDKYKMIDMMDGRNI